MAPPSCALRILSSLSLDTIRALRFTASLYPSPAALRRFTRSRSACRKFDFSTHYNKRTSPKRDLFFYGRGRETRKAPPSCALRILSSLSLDIIRALRFTASLLPPPAALRRFTRSRGKPRASGVRALFRIQKNTATATRYRYFWQG